MTKGELIYELVKARVTEARLKKGYEVKEDGSVIIRQQEYQVIMELSGEFPVKCLYEVIGIHRSSFYNRK